VVPEAAGHGSFVRPPAGWVELTDRHRQIYEDPSIGRDDPDSKLRIL
jgi:hypothetical protein